MTAERWQRLQELVDAASQMPTGDRNEWLSSVCADDPELQLQALAMASVYDTLHQGQGMEEAIVAFAAQASFSSYSPGDKIGPYRILSVLGQGGMGIVYRGARADDQFRQEVAIKVIRAEFGTSESTVARFRAERQILADIDHPHIARLLDGGVTATGFPYLVLEYVEGVDLLTYAAEHRLSLSGRLDLFDQIASAVSHAHQSLVVHRDLKPGNILVSPNGSAKLLDFGIAKLLDPGATDATLVATIPAERPMTPQYASPEQIRGDRITTATDVYGLGLLLYELLTGQRPFRLAGLSRVETERTVCMTGPPLPSIFGLAPEAVPGTKISTDLDRILLKTLHKEPARRYASVADLQADLERYRSGFPVKARPDSVGYRASRFVRRHPWGVGAALAFVLTVFSLGVLLLLQTRRARREAASADAVAQYLVGLFDNAQPDATQGRDTSARELLDQGTGQLESSWHGEPEVKARLLSSLGSVYYQLGDFRRARDLLREGEDIFARVDGPDSPQVADIANSLGEAELDGADYPASLRDYSNSVRIFEKIEPHSAALADAMDGLSGILWKLDRYPESETYHRRSIAMASSVLGPNDPQTLVDKNNYAVLLLDMGRYEEAKAIHRQVLAARLKLFGLQNSHTASSMCNLAIVLLRLGRLDEAHELLQQSLMVREALYPGGHPNIGISLGHLSVYHQQVGETRQALAEAQQALALARRFDGDASLDTAQAQDILGQAYLALGKTADARLWTDKALSLERQIEPNAIPALSQGLDHLGMVALQGRQLDEAEKAISAALHMRQAFYGDDNDRTVWSKIHLAAVRSAQGRYKEAERLDWQALGWAQHRFGAHPNLLTAAAMNGYEEAKTAQGSSRGAARGTNNTAKQAAQDVE